MGSYTTTEDSDEAAYTDTKINQNQILPSLNGVIVNVFFMQLKMYDASNRLKDEMQLFLHVFMSNI